MSTARTTTITIPHLGTDLTFEVDYHWSGRYVRPTQSSAGENPLCEIDDARLIKVDGEHPTQIEETLHRGAQFVDQVDLIYAVLEADAEKYPYQSQDDAMSTDTRI